MTILVNFFRESGSWYTAISLTIPSELLTKENKTDRKEAREWVDRSIREHELSKEMIAVCTSQEIGHPVMIKPTESLKER